MVWEGAGTGWVEASIVRLRDCGGSRRFGCYWCCTTGLVLDRLSKQRTAPFHPFVRVRHVSVGSVLLLSIGKCLRMH